MAMHPTHQLILCASLLCLWATQAHALDRFEIQVYDDDVNKPGHMGVEVHANYTLVGEREAAYVGQLPAHHQARLTFEPAFGLTEFLEVGAYLQFAVQPDTSVHWGGFKLRAKFVVPQRVQLPIHLGLNVEIGRIPVQIEQQGWANELRPIVAWHHGAWSFATNPIIGYALTGPEAFRPEFEPSGKVAFNTQRGFAIGAEYYAGLGLLGEGFNALASQEHLLFAVFDLEPPTDGAEKAEPWALNFAIGHGLTAATAQQWVVKMIFGKEF